MPKISIISALYNHEKFLPQAIESVLNQTFTNWELIIWDDGSTDKSLSIAKKYAAQDPRIRLYQHPGGQNLGQEKTRNAALEKAGGEFVALLDTDDYYDPKKLEVLLPLIEDESVGLAYGKAMTYVEATGRVQEQLVPEYLAGNVFDLLVANNCIAANATLIRKKYFDMGMRFDEKYKTCGEFPLWLSIAAVSKIAFSPLTVAFWRDHGDNTGTRLALKAKQELVDMMDSFLAEPSFSSHKSAILQARAKYRYDLASEKYRFLDMEGARSECLKVVADRYSTPKMKAKAAAIISATMLGAKAGAILSVLKRRVWEIRKNERFRR